MKNQTKIEEVTTLDISLIDDFEGHPFTVKDDESMEELARSIEENGVPQNRFFRGESDFERLVMLTKIHISQNVNRIVSRVQRIITRQNRVIATCFYTQGDANRALLHTREFGISKATALFSQVNLSVCPSIACNLIG